MLMFDASNRDQCEVKRMRTNTPLQALMLMNDPLVLEASRVFAEKLELENSSAEQKIDKAFRSILCRTARPEEMKLLVNYYNDERVIFQNSSAKARQLTSAGEFPHPEIKDVASVAALMQVVHTIYNMEESITKT
jgi:hypothetical protein